MKTTSTIQFFMTRTVMTLLLIMLIPTGVWAGRTTFTSIQETADINDDAVITVTTSTTEMTNATYQVSSDITISSRIQVSGTVELILGEGTTLTASDGIEVPAGASLTISGTGTLIATPTTLDGNGFGKSGIGGYTFGNITINGGNITAKGYKGGAGIGGNENDWSGGAITINGGVVNATGSTTNNGAYGSAGIGGGAASWANQNGTNRGYFTTITINGGQVTVDRMGSPSTHTYGTLVLGWTKLSDFIYANTFSATTISFATDRTFLLEGTETVATKDNINGKKLVPQTKDLSKATISDIQTHYDYTGEAIDITYTVKDSNGATLTEGDDYNATFTKGGNSVTEVKDVGEYTMTLTGMGNYVNTLTCSFIVICKPEIKGLQETYTYKGTPINLNYTVTIPGATLTEGTDYTTAITKKGDTVTEVKDLGKYTLTLTSMVNYISSQTFNFEVIDVPPLLSGNFTVETGMYTDLGETKEFRYILDGDLNSKYATKQYNPSVMFNYKCPVTVIGYVLWTANDQEGKLCNPKSWTLKGKNTGEYDWTIISSIDNTNGDKLPTANSQPTFFNIDNCRAFHEYYFQATLAEGEEFQMAELQLFTLPTEEWVHDLSYADITGLRESYMPKERAIDINYTVQGADGKWLNKGKDFNATITLNGNTVTEVKDKGEYTLTITGKGNYSGSKSVKFKVDNYVRIGHGAVLSSWFPFSGTTYCLTSQIYTAAELDGAGTIMSLRFRTTASSFTRNLDIYLENTDETEPNWAPNAMKVFSGNVTFQQDEWTTITLDEPFYYDGHSNLMIVVDDNTGVNIPTQIPFYVISDSGPSRIAADYYKDVNKNWSPSYNTNDYRSQVIFDFYDGFYVPIPLNLTCTNFTANTATLQWSQKGSVSKWQICLNEDEEHLIEVTEHPYTLTNLTTDKIFSAKVRAVTDDGYFSQWSETVSFEPTAKRRIGSGFATSDNLPANIYSHYCLSQQIYTPQELGEAGNILSIDFFKMEDTTTRRWDIYMVHTDKNRFENENDWISVTEADKVFSGEVAFKGGSWTCIPLDKVFAYDGQHNVAIIIDDNTNDYIFYSYDFLAFDAEKQGLYIYDSYDDIAPANPGSGTLSDVKNQIRIKVISGETTILPKPTDLTCTGYTATTSTLSWTENGTATAWQICLNDDEEHLIEANVNPFTITGLTDDTIYEAKVRATPAEGQICNWSDPVSFETTDKIRIGFDSDYTYSLPISSEEYSLSQQIYTADEIGTAGIITSIDFYSGVEWTKDCDVYFVHTEKTSFDHSKDWISVSDADKVFSGDLTSTTPKWISIKLDTPFLYDGISNLAVIVYNNTGEIVWGGLCNGFKTDKQQAILITSDTELNPNKIMSNGSLCYSKNQIRLAITPVSTPIVPRPTGLTCTGVTTNSATLTWTENGTATKWQICVNDKEDQLIDVTGKTYTLTDLPANRIITAKVRAVTAGGYSMWSDKVSFEPTTKRSIGSGDSYNNCLPIYCYTPYSITEQIFTVQELGEAGNIMSIDFYNTGVQQIRNIDIYMLHTDKSEFTLNSNEVQWLDFSSSDKVFSGNVTFQKEAWTTIPVDAFFAYNGQSNVLLVVDDNTGSTANNYFSFKVFDCGKYQAVYYPNYNFESSNFPKSGGGMTSQKNQVRFGFTTETSIVPMPLELACSDFTSTTATLSWTEKGTATKWQICLDEDEKNLIETNSNPFTITGLKPDRKYTAEVRAVTGNKHSAWSNMVSFQPTDNIQIGSGLSTATDLPIQSYWEYSLSQQIYTADELQRSGSIQSIEFYNIKEPQTRHLEIYMVHTDKNQFEDGQGFFAITKADKVFSGNVTFLQNTWTAINLDTPFAYDGKSNLVIATYDDTNKSHNLEFKVFKAESQSLHRNYYSDINPTDNPSNNGYQSSYKNRLQVKYLQAGDVNGDGKITISDVMTLVKYIVSNTTVGTFIQSTADVNGDGNITIADTMTIIKMILNNP